MKNTLLFLLVTGLLIATTSFIIPSQKDDCLANVQVPKKVTPNDDGVMDYLSIDFPCKPEKFSFKLKNAEGVEVFSTVNYIFQWGCYDKNGDKCPSGVYDWELNYTYKMTIAERKGQVLILR